MNNTLMPHQQYKIDQKIKTIFEQNQVLPHVKLQLTERMRRTVKEEKSIPITYALVKENDLKTCTKCHNYLGVLKDLKYTLCGKCHTRNSL